MEELDLKELFSIFWNRKIYIILITIVFMLMGIVYTLTMVTPKYRSTISIILAKIETVSSSSNDTGSITQAEITLNQKLISTYSEIIKKDIVLAEAIKNLDIDVSEEEIRKNISIKQSTNDSEILEITVANENPEYAALIVNEVEKAFAEAVGTIYNINNITIIQQAKVDTNPYNVNHPKDIIIFTFVGLVVAIGYALIANMLDTTIKTSEDIEKYAKLTTLAEIPLYELEIPTKKGGRK